uniref:Uncharacterized protein n=1 Tax=Eutreptiella gymnastica TaxID=73025 RepID=A0A7S4G387_9EUGL
MSSRTTAASARGMQSVAAQLGLTELAMLESACTSRAHSTATPDSGHPNGDDRASAMAEGGCTYTDMASATAEWGYMNEADMAGTTAERACTVWRDMVSAMPENGIANGADSASAIPDSTCKIGVNRAVPALELTG